MGRVVVVLVVMSWGCASSHGSDEDTGPDVRFDASLDGGPIDGPDGASADAPSIDGPSEPRCGDGRRDTGEECDDGNEEGGDGCASDCTREIICGDGRLDRGESCDDGNTNPGDGCTPMCRREAHCGDRNVDPTEVCDDGDNMSGDGCRSDCLSDETCGNGVLDIHVGEVCDDGGIIDGDGCSANCQLEGCGDETIVAPEECDDGDTMGFDGCGPDCRRERALVFSQLLFADRMTGCDFSGDGEPDNNFALAFGPLGALANDMFLADAAGRDIIILLNLLGLDDPSGQNDDYFQMGWSLGDDADGNADNNLSGMGRFTPDSTAFDAMGRYKASFVSAVDGGALLGGPEDVELPLPFFALDLRRATLSGTMTQAGGEVTGISEGLLCGAIPVFVAAFLPNPLELAGFGNAPPCVDPEQPASLADILLAGTGRAFILPLRGATPDVDIDGDGLEYFEVTSTGERGCQPVVTACTDGDGRRVEGRECLRNARFEDGWSAAFQYEAVRAILER